MVKDCSGRSRKIEFPIPEFAEVLDKAAIDDSADNEYESDGNEYVSQDDKDVICTTYYQSECITKQEEHQV